MKVLPLPKTQILCVFEEGCNQPATTPKGLCEKHYFVIWRADHPQAKNWKAPESAPCRRWTDTERSVMRELLLTHPLSEVAAKLNRTEAAIISECWRRDITVSEHALTSLLQATKLLRHSKEMIRAACTAIHVTPTKAGRSWRFTEHQLDALRAYFQRKSFRSSTGHPTLRWSRHHSACKRCGTSGTKCGQQHKAKGLCRVCYNREGWLTRGDSNPQPSPGQGAARL
jgi:hypothetical protein